MKLFCKLTYPDGHNFTLELAFLLGLHRFCIAFGGKYILLFSGDPIILCNVLRSDSHREQAVRGCGLEKICSEIFSGIVPAP